MAQLPRIYRMSGAGNRFLFLDLLDGSFSLPSEERAEFVRQRCTSDEIIDGFVFIEKYEGPSFADFGWDFYNRDGSKAEMCGNAARCAVWFFERFHGSRQRLRFHTQVGFIEGEVRERTPTPLVRIRMPPLKSSGDFRQLPSLQKQEPYFYIDTGVPHVVLDENQDAVLAKNIRWAPELFPRGTNVTFVKKIQPQPDLGLAWLDAISFERGVENFTEACGTGAMAGAAFARRQHPGLKVFFVKMPGGILRIEWVNERVMEIEGHAQFERSER